MLITRQGLRALQFMHLNQRLHRDIKPHNILINRYGEVKLSDFGISQKVSDEDKETTGFCGTMWYVRNAFEEATSHIPLQAIFGHLE